MRKVGILFGAELLTSAQDENKLRLIDAALKRISLPEPPLENWNEDASSQDCGRALRNYCSQCGGRYTDRICGIGHMSMQNLRKFLIANL